MGTTKDMSANASVFRKGGSRLSLELQKMRHMEGYVRHFAAKELSSLKHTSMNMHDISAPVIEVARESFNNVNSEGRTEGFAEQQVLPECAYTMEHCRKVALHLGLRLGSGADGWEFVGRYSDTGCFAYRADDNSSVGHAFYGLLPSGKQVDDDAQLTTVRSPKFRLQGTQSCQQVACLYSQQACRNAAQRLGLELGSRSWPFAGNFSETGCFAYSSGEFARRAFYGLLAGKEVHTGSELSHVGPHKYRIDGQGCATVDVHENE